MRKRLITTTSQDAPLLGEGWLDLDGAAVVEVTSEEKEYPVESALVSGEAQGWRAASPGTQTVRLLFDEPQKLRRISLVFEEPERHRTQEFVLRWSSDGGRSYREIVRQQWNFSPPDAMRESEEYQVQLSDVTALELIIVPDISRGAARASLKTMPCLDSLASLLRGCDRLASMLRSKVHGAPPNHAAFYTFLCIRKFI